SFSMLIQLSTTTLQSLQMRAGLSNPAGTTQPPQSDLVDEVLINQATDLRHRFNGQADRHLTSLTVFAMVISSGSAAIVQNSGPANGQQSITVAQSRQPTRWRATCTLL